MSAMATLLVTIGEVFTKIISFIPTIADLYTTEPILTLTVAFVVAGFAVGIFGRLLSRG